jgi:beta-N-acetylhexosaminidase
MPALSTLDALRLAPFHLDDASIAWVRTTLNRLSTEQKVRQLLNLPAHGDDPRRIDTLIEAGVGGVTRFGGVDLCASWQATRRLIENADIPLLISGDIEGGAIGLPFGTPMPNQLGLAATGSTALGQAAVDVLATEARAMGYNWTFTPVTDINAAFRSAIVATRSYGSDVETILAQARINVQTFQRHGIAATAKHWPGEGFDDRDQHLVTTQNPLSMAQWHAGFGQIYRGLMDAGVMSVMSAHIGLPAYARLKGESGLELSRPASVSRWLNTTLLREEMGFNGVIVSDASGMAGLSGWADRAEFVPQVIASGCDVLLFPSSFEHDLQHLLQALLDERLSETRLEDAVTRVLGFKAALGLHRKTLDELLPPLDHAQKVIRSPSHLATAARVSAASITLVKDVNGLLPLRLEKHRRIVIITEAERTGFAGNPALQLEMHNLLIQRGYDVRPFDPGQPPTTANTDVVLYVLAQESLLSRSHIYMDWARLHGDWRGAMQRYWHQIPCMLVSFGHPYYLYDAPRMPCLINAYTATLPVQQAVVRKMLGDEAFVGQHPVDAFCGLEDARY